MTLKNYALLPVMFSVVYPTVLLLSSSVELDSLWSHEWQAARQASLSFTISRSLLRLMSIESVMPLNHLILCCSFFLLPINIPSNVSLISSSNQVAKVLELQHESFQWILLAIVQVTFCSRLFISKSQDLNSIHWKKQLVKISYVYSKGLRNA